MQKQSRETVQFRVFPQVHAVQAVWGHRVRNTFPRHTHRMVCVGIVDSGNRVIAQKVRETVVPEGCAFVLNAGESHACGSREREGHSYRVICIEPAFLRSIASGIADKDRRVPYFRALPISDHGLARLMNRFFSLLEPGTLALEQESCLWSLCSWLVMHHATDGPAPYKVNAAHSAVDRAREYIEAHFTENLSLEQLGRIAGVSPFHFQRSFLSHVGVSPHEYLIQYRLRRAREFLHRGHSIAETALDTGFVDQSHFTRFFTRVMGIAPGKYVRLCRGTSDAGDSLR